MVRGDKPFKIDEDRLHASSPPTACLGNGQKGMPQIRYSLKAAGEHPGTQSRKAGKR